MLGSELQKEAQFLQVYQIGSVATADPMDRVISENTGKLRNRKAEEKKKTPHRLSEGG